PLFREFAQTWLTENAATWKQSVLEGYQATVRDFLNPRFGHYEVGAITKADVLAFRAELVKTPGKGGKPRSPSRINNIMKPLRGILTEASDRFDFPNPFRGVKKLRETKKDIHPFTLDEVMLLCREVRRDYQNYLIVRFFTGMRTGEIDGLKWKYVDFERNLILVRETVLNGRVETPKTQSSVRDIVMLPIVREALIDQRKYTGNKELVFCTRAGTPLHPNNFRRRVWQPLLRRLGLPIRRPYETRHTAATLWLASGENPEWVARQLGHSNTEMLFRVYSRYIPNLTHMDGTRIHQLIEHKLKEVNHETDR
ncbi:MAG: site-specific integrase, partial [Anaerolineae bacterium]